MQVSEWFARFKGEKITIKDQPPLRSSFKCTNRERTCHNPWSHQATWTQNNRPTRKCLGYLAAPFTAFCTTIWEWDEWRLSLVQTSRRRGKGSARGGQWCNEGRSRRWFRIFNKIITGCDSWHYVHDPESKQQSDRRKSLYLASSEKKKNCLVTSTMSRWH